MLAEAAAQVAPVVSEARTLDRFIAPARSGSGRWPAISGGAGTTIPPACSAISTRCAGGSSITIRSPCWPRFRSRKLERRAGELVLHSRINYAYRRLQEYLQADRTWGATHAGVLRPRPVAYFSAEFGLHESLPDLFRRPGRPRRRPHQERVRPGHSAGRHRPVLRPGIFPAAARSRTAGSRKNTWTPTSASCRWSRPSARTASR